MKKFALLDKNNVVLNISIADDSWNSTGWVEYTDSNPASIGGDYVDGHFYSVQPYPSWTRSVGNWQPPTPMPSDGYWIWNEEKLQWQQFGN